MLIYLKKYSIVFLFFIFFLEASKNQINSKNFLNFNEKYPTDRGLFEENINDILKRSILNFGPCKPTTNFPSNIHGRQFSTQYYQVTMKSGLKIPRRWLCYSIVLDKAYCEICWLFANRTYGNFKSEWINGINDRQHLSQCIQRHETSIQHFDALKVHNLWVKNQTVDANLERQYSEEATKWRNVLKRLIQIILTITSGNTALRGNEGSLKIQNPTEGNFLRIVKLLAQFDPILNNLLSNEEQKIKYLSWAIQNELIDILATDLRRTICNDIKSSCFFSVILDSTQDITKKDQVSLVIRYTKVDFEQKIVEVKESFLGFFVLKKHGAADYSNLLLELLSKYELNISKCRGQGYDGAAVMSGSFSGLQKRICEIVPNATFMHCCSHNINLIICDAAKSSRKVQSFFEIVQDIFNFFSSSGPRWTDLAFGEEEGTVIRKVVLKKLCATRWEARHNALYSLRMRFVDILKALTKLQLTSTKKNERDMALALKKKLESPEFILILCVWENILKSMQFVSKKLQSVDLHLQQALDQLNTAISDIKLIRENYDTIVDKAKKMCDSWSIHHLHSIKAVNGIVNYFPVKLMVIDD